MSSSLSDRIEAQLQRNREAIKQAENTSRWINLTLAHSSLVTEHALAVLRADLKRCCR